MKKIKDKRISMRINVYSCTNDAEGILDTLRANIEGRWCMEREKNQLRPEGDPNYTCPTDPKCKSYQIKVSVKKIPKV